ncbi:DUF5130 domain-containing protein [Blastococcus sp. TBT05-19]|uniref:DUF5130 family protein n=1 Tax=Blastococcus sp. TBT05-19 TaxID=2250581 RepID=UPI000DE81C44|nr:DUF5130 family protein [Blastococcus sp. TBT05-19]RBY94688.1 DUF5130 domain-containing protein [Blastococcus sp. TBT05-19]
MTRALEVDSHDTATQTTAAARTDEGGGSADKIFSYKELARLDEALTMSSRETGLRFTLYVGELRSPTRLHAEELHARSGDHPTDAVLIAISPGQRVVEVVTGAAAARRLPDRACALAVLSMTSSFANGDLVGGTVNGLRQLSDQAGHPASLRH